MFTRDCGTKTREKNPDEKSDKKTVSFFNIFAFSVTLTKVVGIGELNDRQLDSATLKKEMKFSPAVKVND